MLKNFILLIICAAPISVLAQDYEYQGYQGRYNIVPTRAYKSSYGRYDGGRREEVRYGLLGGAVAAIVAGRHDRFAAAVAGYAVGSIYGGSIDRRRDERARVDAAKVAALRETQYDCTERYAESVQDGTNQAQYSRDCTRKGWQTAPAREIVQAPTATFAMPASEQQVQETKESITDEEMEMVRKWREYKKQQ